MQIETLGHASLLLREDDGTPVLLTDPWLTGSCYWRSWWLQHYPDHTLMQDLGKVPYCYITHEHPDHFHLPSIRALGTSPTYLAPDLPEEKIAAWLQGTGFRSEVVPSTTWKQLSPTTRILSIPAPNDDSILIVDTPRAVIVNFNDGKPGRKWRAQLKAYLDAHFTGKSRILLSSYSPASLVNSFFSKGKRLNLRVKSGYVRAVSTMCDDIGADFFMPFASQVVFRRSDSQWANDFKVVHADLEAGWSAKARLFPCYATLSLPDDAPPSLTRWVRPEDYQIAPAQSAEKIARQQALDEDPLGPEDIRLLGAKLRVAAPFLGFLFPFGLGFRGTGRDSSTVLYNPWLMRAALSTRKGSVTFHVPSAILRDILVHGRFGDLGITMSVRVDLNRGNAWLAARLVYILFFWITLHDYGHTSSPRAFLRWLRTLRSRPLPPPDKHHGV